MGRPGLTIHPKFRRLVHLLAIPAPHALGHLEFLWIPAYENGNPEIGDAVDVELAAGWVGEEGKLSKALLECGGKEASGFIEEIPEKPGRFQIHDLYDHAPDYVRKRWAREQERQRSGKTVSDIRAEAARVRWKKAPAGEGIELQTDSKECKRPPFASCHDANVVTPAPAPAPAQREGGRKRPVCAKPSLEDAQAFFSEKSLDGDPAEFFDHYEANGWKQSGGQPLKDWHAAARQWSRRQPQFAGRNVTSKAQSENVPSNRPPYRG